MKTAHLRAEFEGKVKAAREELEAFRKPFDDQFDADTKDIHEQITAEYKELEQQHRYACHNAVLASGIHETLTRLEEEFKEKTKPLQTKWNELSGKDQKKLKRAVDARIKEHNKLVEKLNEEFNALIKPDLDAYTAEAAELEKQILNTPVGEAA